MLLEKLVVGLLSVNCYIAGDKDEALVIDPGANAQKIYNFLQEKGIKVKYIVLTHCHFDHILGVCELQKLTNAKIVICDKEKDNLKNHTINMTESYSKKKLEAENIVPDMMVCENDEIVSGEFSFRVIETPGHTSGGMCLYCEGENVLFSGDTLFFQSIGRTDFPTGDYKTLIGSIKTKLFSLPEKTKVLPGHEAETTIRHEMLYNPYLR